MKVYLVILIKLRYQSIYFTTEALLAIKYDGNHDFWRLIHKTLESN